MPLSRSDRPPGFVCHHGACGEGIVDECYHKPGLTWVAQDDPGGCGVACLAMLLKTTYDDARAQLVADPMSEKSGAWKDGDSTNAFVIEGFLSRRGWFKRTLYKLWDPDNWPTPAFTDRHIVQVVQPSGNSHFVAMDGHGIVLDPLRPGNYRLSDWPEINHITGWVLP